MTEDRAREPIYERAANRIFIRMPGVPMLGRCIRVMFGAGEQPDIFRALRGSPGIGVQIREI